MGCGIPQGMTQGPSPCAGRRTFPAVCSSYCQCRRRGETTLLHGSRKQVPALLLYLLSSPGRDGTHCKRTPLPLSPPLSHSKYNDLYALLALTLMPGSVDTGIRTAVA